MRINRLEIQSHTYNTASILPRHVEIPYYMQVVSREFGIKWVNDSFSESINRVWFALEEVCGKLVWITHAYHHSKHTFKDIEQLLLQKAEAIIYIGHSSDSIDYLSGFVPAIFKVENMQQAVCLAKRITPKGETVLYSPGVKAVYCDFINYEQRGIEFMRCLNKIL